MSANPPQISVIVPTFNRAIFLAECLDSLLAQTLPATQIIVVNNGSSDDTPKVCAAYAGRVEYYETPQSGKSVAINLGLSKCRGDYIWVFDDDDVALPDALARFVEPLEKDRSYGFSFSTFYYSESDPVTNKIGKVLYELKIPDLNQRGFLIPLLEANFLGGAGLFARSVCYKEVGGFDESLLRSQDYEMAIRIARRFQGVRVPDSGTFHYRQHVGERGALADRFAFEARGRKWLEYDQVFFRKLYREVPLSDYLFPGDNYPAQKRQAIFQRMAIMAIKLLYEEIKADLKLLLNLEDTSRISSQEYEIIWGMVVRTPRHGVGDFYQDCDIFREIGRLAKSSLVIRLLRAKILRAVLSRWKATPSVFSVWGVLKRVVLLYT